MIIHAIDRLWEEAVILEGEDRVLRVQSTRDAFLCLKNHWPLSEGAATQSALALCEQGLSAPGDDPMIACRAFIDAAREAGFRVNSWLESESMAFGNTAAADEREEWIAKRAYALWEADGCQHGRDREHWEQALRERAELERVALPGHLGETPPTDESDEKTDAAIRHAQDEAQE